ncbi:hypothetical protein PV328_007805 [Microctonus aethiopoides]|uniref:Uncharacterized protein n=1 Tax=Microctonus aethiopoides TaxID=144406 RepID=A0AA39F1J5_9HYME|nr:hypothetical protein PV328_007805 [Microctonus aethiopoides]
MNAANYVLSLKDEVGEMFMLYLTREEHERAIGDILYASKLLDRYKNAIAMQLYNIQQSNLTVSDLIPENLQPLKLIDEEEVFNLLVTEEEANKALEETMKLALNQAKINYFEDAIKNRQLKREEKARYNERKLQIFEKIAESLKK